MDRNKMKAWAKAAIHQNYWKSVLVAFVLYGAIFFVTYFISYGTGFGFGYGFSFGVGSIVALFEGGTDQEAIIVFAFMALIFIAIGVCLTATGVAGKAFLANHLEVGCKKYYCNSLDGSDAKLSQMGAGFNKNYKNIAKVMFTRDVYLTLWGALWMGIYMIVGMAVLFGGLYLGGFIGGNYEEGLLVVWMFFLMMIVYIICMICFIPLYIKILEYMFVPYILADYPDMPKKQVFEMSKRMINGSKWDVFVMHMSFAGWFILSGCTCYILHILYVGPYMEYTTVAYYKTLKEKVCGQN